MKFRARVFKKDGNRFLIPGYWCPEDDDGWDGKSEASILCDGMMMSVVCGFDGPEEWMEFDADAEGRIDLHHIPYLLGGRQFAHGGIDVLLIGGPLFDEQTAKAATTETP